MKHLLDAKDISKSQAEEILEIAKHIKSINTKNLKKLPALSGKTVVNLFYENSTRTRISFEVAAKKLSADIIDFKLASSSVAKGESLKDTAKTLSALGANCVIIRHFYSGAAKVLADSDWIDASVINAGDGTHQHPTQALLDAFTIKERFGDFKGLNILIVGDIAHSRVARSDMILFKTLGCNISFCAPPTLSADFGCKTYFDLDKALKQKPDIIIMLRIQKERMESDFFPSLKEYIAYWSLNEKRFAKLDNNTLIMHPGPVNRGLEICSKAIDSPQCLITSQVENGVNVRMAVLYYILCGGEK